jgi:hypothetical protein
VMPLENHPKFLICRNISFTSKSRSLPGVVLLERVQLTGCDLVALEGVALGMKGAHVFHKGSRDRGRYSNSFRSMPQLATKPVICSKVGLCRDGWAWNRYCPEDQG